MSVPVGMRLLLVSEPAASASMLLRVCAGLSRPHGGRVQLAGLRADWQRRVAYLPPDPGMHSWMTPREVIGLSARLADVPGDEVTRRVDDALVWVRIGSVEADRPLSRAGPGLRQRTGLGAALVGDPEVLLLDEALRALDADERTAFLALPGRRRTVVMASRYPATERDFVTHVALIRGGRLALLAPVGEFATGGQPLSLQRVATVADARGR